MKNGTKVATLIVILLIIGSLFLGVVSATDAGENVTNTDIGANTSNPLPSENHDLAVTTLIVIPSSPAVGQSAVIYVTVRNEGVHHENDVPVTVSVDGAQVGTVLYSTSR